MDVDTTELDVTIKLFHCGVKSCQNLVVDEPNASVQFLLNLIHETFKFPSTQYDLVPVHCGHRLQLDSLLSDYNIKTGCCVNVIATDIPSQHDAASTSGIEGAAILQRLFDSSYKYLTKTVLTNSDNIEELAFKLPSLKEDLVAQGMLKNFSLMQMLVNSGAVDSLMEKHPCMASVAAHLSDIIISKNGRDKSMHTTVRTEANKYALDAMSDDDDDDVPVQRITTGQLSAAIALAQGNSEQTPSTSSTPAASSSTQPAASYSTQPAASYSTQPAASYSTQPAASSSTQPAATAGQSTSSEGQASARASEGASGVKFEQELKQLLTLGITDKELALRSLEASGGNVNLALDIIYGGDI